MTLPQALAYYLTQPGETDTVALTDLITAAKRARVWRTKGPEATATILKALRDDYHMTYADIEDKTGIDDSTAQRLIRQLESGKWAG
ncbi:MAG: hypothetical protein ACRDRO_09730 [Pseudonocardiaceae bacterium]